MDIKSAINLLENTFRSKFNMDNFEYFLTELFNEVRINVKNETTYVKKEFKEFINQFYTIGSYNDEMGDSIGFYVVELSKKSTRDRARTMQRNLIASFMKNQHKNAALVAFYEHNNPDWRFSYITLSYEFADDGIKEKLSSPRRHSFLVGPNEPNHTCQKQFLGLLTNESNILLEDIQEAFDIENVTDDFFNEYKRLFLDLADSLRKVKEKDDIVKDEFNLKHIKSTDFAKKLMGQLVFIYFLQKKGWLGVEKDADWGTGPKNFLRNIFDKCIKDNKNFFNDVLEPLFYEGLSSDVPDYHYSQFGFKVPFLNGGLFEPINDYNWIETDVNLDNSIFSSILDTFDKFNFTIKEDEPLEKEVAVDPEMLGKVFENLLEVVDRKSKGAFYTPRHIVHYMCQENLISYLDTNSDVSEEDLRVFITEGDLAIDSIIRVNEQIKGYGKQFDRIKLPDSIKEHSDELEQLLKKVKVIDPAVGSGAFPVGMMNEIVKARYILRLINGVEDVNLYNLKRETIENSLYGVDLEYSATDVTKLRFWLSLIVDEEDINHIKPLPNLDNQIMCGNSIIDGYKDVKLFDDNLIIRSEQTKLAMTSSERTFQDIEKKKKEYFDTSNPNRKLELKNEIKELKWTFVENYLKDIGEKDLVNEIKKYEHAEAKPFFIWELEFSEVFKGSNPGFDIVIGNPPYVRQEKIKELKPYLKEYYETYTGVADLYVYFFEKGLKILKDKGIFAFICSNKFAKANYGKKLRKLILENQLKIYNDFTGLKIFKEASVDTCVIQIKKDFIENNEVYVDDEYFMKQNKLNSNSFMFNSPQILDLREKIFNQGTLIKDLDIQINYGIKTGFNKAFIIDEKTKDKLISEDFNNKEIIKPLLRGRDIDKWRINYDNLYLIHSYDGLNIFDKYPIIYNYLSQYKEKLEKRYDKGKNWYNLRACSYDDLFEKEKIIYSEISRKPQFTYDLNEYYLSNTAYLINSEKINLKYLLGLLNSNVIFWIFKHISYNLGESSYRFIKQFVEQIPIVVDNENLENIIFIVDQILLYSKQIKNEKIKMYNLIMQESCNNKLSKKLESFYKLSEKEFLKDIKKINKNINEDELLKKFNLSKIKINSIISKFDNSNQKLNKLIYKSYKLNTDEIKIIEDDLIK